MGGIGFSDDAHTLHLDDFVFDEGDKFSYEYNFFDHWIHDIRVEHIEKATHNKRILYCIKGSGMPGANKSDEVSIKLKLLKAIIDKKKSSTCDISDLIDEFRTIRFCRQWVNKQLTKLNQNT